MKRTMIASVVACLATSGLAFAHGAHKGLARFDRDGNGVVTKDEMRTSESERFDKVDANKDGKITLDEIQAAHRERAAKHFAEKDTNKDGKLGRSEVPNMPDAIFAKLDENKDGFLTPDELAKKGARFAEHAQRHFEHTDANHDGAISKDEALAAADQRFAKMDTNGDGVISQDEMQAHRGHRKPGDASQPNR